MARTFVYKFIRIIAPLTLCLAYGSAHAQTSVSANQKTSQLKTIKSANSNVDFFSKEKIDLLKELDEVMREMIWLIRSERPSSNKTLFGKVFRAVNQAKGIKLIERSKHTCDQYTIEKVSEFQFRFFEFCQKHRNPDQLSKVDWSHKRASFVFQGQNYVDVLGAGAALVAPIIDCQASFDDSVKLVDLSCTGFRITRADQVIRFETVRYRKGKDPLIYLKGEVLKNLLPFSDLQISVPLSGKVKILEKKKVPDADEITQEMKNKLKEKPKMPPTVPAMDPRSPVPDPVEGADSQSQPATTLPPSINPKILPPTMSPREEGDGVTAPPPLEMDRNFDLRKNSDPDVIEIKEPTPSR